MKNNVSKKKSYTTASCRGTEMHHFNSNKHTASCLHVEGMVPNKWLVLTAIKNIFHI